MSRPSFRSMIQVCKISCPRWSAAPSQFSNRCGHVTFFSFWNKARARACDWNANCPMPSLVTMKRVLSFSGVTLVRMHLYGTKHNVPKWGTKPTTAINGYAPTIASPQIHLQMGQFHRKRLDFLGPNTWETYPKSVGKSFVITLARAVRAEVFHINMSWTKTIWLGQVLLKLTQRFGMQNQQNITKNQHSQHSLSSE